MRLEVLVGMVGSGKSTYARGRADQGALVVCHDDLTQMLHGGCYRYEQELRECYRRMEESLAWRGLDAGRDVIIDRTHLTRESRQRWIKWAKNFELAKNSEWAKYSEVPVVAVVFPLDTPEIHARRRFIFDSRGRSYEEWLAVARHHFEQARRESIFDDEGFSEIRYMNTQPLPPIATSLSKGD